VVEAALHTLMQQGLTPRYQFHEENAASRMLAEAVGMHQFVTMEHWLAP
jgi:hypothetical protein